MALKVKRYTAAEFDEFVELAENSDRLFELIGGEIVEVPPNPYSTKIASRINRYLGTFVGDNDLGHVTGEAGGCVVSGDMRLMLPLFQKNANLNCHSKDITHIHQI